MRRPVKKARESWRAHWLVISAHKFTRRLALRAVFLPLCKADPTKCAAVGKLVGQGQYCRVYKFDARKAIRFSRSEGMVKRQWPSLFAHELVVRIPLSDAAQDTAQEGAALMASVPPHPCIERPDPLTDVLGVELYREYHETLKAALQRTRAYTGNLSWADVCHIAAPLFDALVHLHQHKRVHADIKAENLLVKWADHTKSHWATAAIVVTDVDLVARIDTYAPGRGTPGHADPQAFKTGERYAKDIEHKQASEIFRDECAMVVAMDVYSACVTLGYEVGLGCALSPEAMRDLVDADRTNGALRDKLLCDAGWPEAAADACVSGLVENRRKRPTLDALRAVFVA